MKKFGFSAISRISDLIVPHFSSIYILLLVGFPLFAQDDLRLKYYALEHGLSQVTINELLRDDSGFIWIGTQDGLNRFDGTEFKVYKYNQAVSGSISGNHIESLLQDRARNIWVGTLGNGLNKYDYDLDLFQRVPLKKPSVPNETILDMVMDHNGHIWISTRKSGLYRFSTDENGQNQKVFLKNKSLHGLSVDGNNLWVGGYDGSVFRIDLKNPLPEVSPELKVEGNVQAIYSYKQKLLLGTDSGMFIYNKQNRQHQKVNLDITGGSPTRHVVTFLKADESSVWIGTGSGLFLFDVDLLKVLDKVEYTQNGKGGLSNNTVQSLLRSADKQIFAGTANGLNLLNFEKPYFKNISKNKKGSHLLNDNVIFSILKDEEDLWVGTSDGGLNLIRKEKVYYFKENQNSPFSISGNVVREICKDQENERLWIATTRGLSMIDLKTFDVDNPKFRVFRHKTDKSNSISNDFLKGIALDKEGKVWGAAFGHGIFSLQLDSNGNEIIKRFKNEKENSSSIINDFVQCISVDHNGEIWVGSQGGLTKISYQADTHINPTITNFTRKEGNENTLSHNSVYDILIDAKNKKWIATRYGLNLMLDDGSFKSWTEQKQFTSAIIYGIQDDLDGNLWLGTTAGIVHFNSKTNNFKQYGVKDGIQSNEFDIHARFRDDEGLIYLGGIDGLTYFHPRDLTNIDQPHPLLFSEFRIRDEIIRPENHSRAVLQNALIKTEHLKLTNNQFPFYLQFSSIDFRFNRQVEFGYKLLPNDDKWNMLKDAEVQFLNLPTGNHTLLVNGFSRGLEWNQEPLRMSLQILPPWWATWWAYTFYVLLMLSLAYFFYRFQVSRKLAFAESKRLKEINQLKNSLYTNITHEFRTPLTIIMGMAESIKDNIRDHKFRSLDKPLEMIERNGRNLLQLVNEMLDLAKLESGNMEVQLIQSDVVPFVKYICESLQSYAKERDVNLIVYSEIDSLVMDFDEQKIQAIVYNLLSNAIKFSEGGDEVIVHLNKNTIDKSDFLSIKVKDMGIGIAKDALPHIFNRFYQADTTISRNREGTGIGLSLTKNFVELMKGSISAKSELGQGTEFLVHLPIYNMAKASDVVYSEIENPKATVKPIGDAFGNRVSEDSDLPIALIIEDNIDVAYFLKNSLKGKYQTLYAENGSIGVEIAFDQIPDVIICDVMMPIMDGYQVCQTLKSDKRTDHIPIIMLTAKVTQNDRLAGLTYGADAYLKKPFQKAELFTRLDQLILLRKKIIEKFDNDGFTDFLRAKTENPETKFLQELIKVVNQEIGNANFGPKQLAFRLRLSESQTYRKIRSITNKSTAVFIRSVRLQRAKELLLTTHKTVSEIAYDVGFNDPSWFSRAFKEEFGCTPSAIHK